MVIGLRYGASSYKHIPVLELTPKQLAENKRRAKALGEHLQKHYALLQSLPMQNLKHSDILPTIMIDWMRGDMMPFNHAEWVECKTECYRDYCFDPGNPLPEATQREQCYELIDKIIASTQQLHQEFKGTPLPRAVLRQFVRSDFKKANYTNLIKREAVKLCEESLNHQSMQKLIAERIKPSHAPFDKAVEQSCKSNTLFLDAMQELLALHGVACDTHQMFKDNSLATWRLISGEDVIIADYTAQTEGGYDSDHVFAPFQPTIGGRTYSFAFIKDLVPNDASHPNHMRTGAGYLIDHRILDTLKEYGAQDEMDARLLSGFLTVARLADHDYWHNMTIRYNAGDPQFQTHIPDGATDEDNLSRLAKNVSPTTPIMLPNTTPYESKSVLLHYSIMQEIFKHQPGIKKRVIEQAVQFLQNVEEMGNRIAAGSKPDSAEASAVVEYLTSIYFNRLSHILSRQDQDVEIQTDHGRTSITKQVCRLMNTFQGSYHYLRTSTADLGNHKAQFKTNGEAPKGTFAEHMVSHTKRMQETHAARAKKNQTLKKLEYPYFIDQGGAVDQLKEALSTHEASFSTEEIERMREKIERFEQLMHQVATRVECGTLDRVAMPIQERKSPIDVHERYAKGRSVFNMFRVRHPQQPLLDAEGKFVFRAIKDTLPHVADQLMEVASELNHACAYDTAAIAEKLARLKEAWRDVAEQKTLARI